MLRWNLLQYLTEILRQYFVCNERLEIFLTYFCNILCYVGWRVSTLITGQSQQAKPTRKHWRQRGPEGNATRRTLFFLEGDSKEKYNRLLFIARLLYLVKRNSVPFTTYVGLTYHTGTNPYRERASPERLAWRTSYLYESVSS